MPGAANLPMPVPLHAPGFSVPFRSSRGLPRTPGCAARRARPLADASDSGNRRV